MSKLIPFRKAFLWLLIISVLSLMPADELPKNSLFTIPHLDKIVHFVMYFLLCMFLFKPLGKVTKTALIIAPVAAFIISGIFEVLQLWFTGSRNASVYDLLANLSGVVVALLIYQFIIKNSSIERFF